MIPAYARSVLNRLFRIQIINKADDTRTCTGMGIRLSANPAHILTSYHALQPVINLKETDQSQTLVVIPGDDSAAYTASILPITHLNRQNNVALLMVHDLPDAMMVDDGPLPGRLPDLNSNANPLGLYGYTLDEKNSLSPTWFQAGVRSLSSSKSILDLHIHDETYHQTWQKRCNEGAPIFNSQGEMVGLVHHREEEHNWYLSVIPVLRVLATWGLQHDISNWIQSEINYVPADTAYVTSSDDTADSEKPCVTVITTPGASIAFTDNFIKSLEDELENYKIQKEDLVTYEFEEPNNALSRQDVSIFILSGNIPDDHLNNTVINQDLRDDNTFVVVTEKYEQTTPRTYESEWFNFENWYDSRAKFKNQIQELVERIIWARVARQPASTVREDDYLAQRLKELQVLNARYRLINVEKKVQSGLSRNHMITKETTLDKVLQEAPHLVLIGPAGSGKTAQVNYWNEHYIKQWQDDNVSFNRFPLSIDFGQWDDGQSFEDFIHEQWKTHISPAPLRPWENLILFADSLENLQGDIPGKIDALQQWMQTHNRSCLVTTCRQNRYGAPPFDFPGHLVSSLEITPLNAGQIRQIAWQYFDVAEEKDEFLTRIQIPMEFSDEEDDNQLNSLVRNPYLLVRLIKIYRQDKSNLPNNRVDLIHELVRLMSEREIGRGTPYWTNTPRPLDSLVNTLGQIAFDMYQNQQNSLSISQFESYFPGELSQLQAAREASYVRKVKGKIQFAGFLQAYFAGLHLQKTGIDNLIETGHLDSIWFDAIIFLHGLIMDYKAEKLRQKLLDIDQRLLVWSCLKTIHAPKDQLDELFKYPPGTQVSVTVVETTPNEIVVELPDHPHRITIKRYHISYGFLHDCRQLLSPGEVINAVVSAVSGRPQTRGANYQLTRRDERWHPDSFFSQGQSVQVYVPDTYAKPVIVRRKDGKQQQIAAYPVRLNAHYMAYLPETDFRWYWNREPAQCIQRFFEKPLDVFYDGHQLQPDDDNTFQLRVTLRDPNKKPPEGIKTGVVTARLDDSLLVMWERGGVGQISRQEASLKYYDTIEDIPYGIGDTVQFTRMTSRSQTCYPQLSIRRASSEGKTLAKLYQLRNRYQGTIVKVNEEKVIVNFQNAHGYLTRSRNRTYRKNHPIVVYFCDYDHRRMCFILSHTECYKR